MTYNTREEAVASLASDAERVQYDGNDHERIKDMAATFTHHAIELIEGLGNYAKEVEAKVDEADTEAVKDAAAAVNYARRELIEKWATLQLAASKVAFVMRVDGQTAYDRLVAALNIEGGNIDMSGL